MGMEILRVLIIFIDVFEGNYRYFRYENNLLNN